MLWLLIRSVVKNSDTPIVTGSGSALAWQRMGAIRPRDVVQKKGGQVVTSEDVTAARRALAGDFARGEQGNDAGGEGFSRTTGATPGYAGGGFSARELAHIEEMVAQGPVLEGLKTRYHESKVCGGAAAGCLLSLINDRAVAGCPNACS